MNNNISDKDKKDWKNFLSKNEKLINKDLNQNEKKIYKIKSIDLHGYSLEEANILIEKTINEILYIKCKSAMLEFISKYKNDKKVFVISGGVASNKSIRNNLDKLSKEMGFENFFPPIELCSDNGAMIAWAGIERFKKGIEDDLEVLAKPRWPLDPDAPFLKGAGVKY